MTANGDGAAGAGRFHVVRLHCVQPEAPSVVCQVGITADRDPDLPVRPGEAIGFEMTITPHGEGARYYSYLMTDSFERVATLEQPSGISRLPNGERHASSTTPGEVRVATFTLRVHPHVRRDAFLVPQVRAGIITGGGSSLTATTFNLKDRGFRIASLPPQGRAMVVAPGHRAVLTSLTEGSGDDVRLVGVGPARLGAVGTEADGTVAYTPYRGAAGYDWFDYVLEDGQGLLTRGRVTVYVGDLGPVGGLLAG